MKKLKHILLEQGILGQNIDIQTGKPIAMATPGRKFAPMLFDPKTAATQLMAVKFHNKRNIPAENKNIILAIPDSTAYNTVSIEFKKMASMTLPEFIFKYGLPTDTNGAVSFLNDIKRHLTKIKSSTFLISPYNEKIKQLSVSVATSNPASLAKKLYNTRPGLDGGDDAIVKLILSIKDINQFNQVQEAFKIYSKGVGIAKYFGKTLSYGMEHNDIKSYKRTNNVLNHFKKIGANDKDISQLQYTFNTILRTNPVSGMRDTVADGRDMAHNVLSAVSIGASFFGPYGLALSSAIQAVEAKMFFDEGKDYEGGLALTFAALPGIGKLVGGPLKPFLKGLIQKIVSKSGNYTKLEREVLIRTAMSKDIIRNKLNTGLKDGIESGIINPVILPASKFVKSAGNGVYRLTIGAVKHAFVPMVAYDAAYEALNPPMTVAELNQLMYTELKANISRRLKNIK